MEVRVKSGKGFYLGDVCYVLGDGIYHGIWGASGYKDGEVEVPPTGFSFAVAGTAYGDGGYVDGEGNVYGVDAGVIGLVPLELIGKIGGLENGRVFFQSGEAEFEAEDGVFFVSFPNGEHVLINTRDDEEYEEDEWNEEDEWDDCDDDMGYDPYLGCYTDDV